MGEIREVRAQVALYRQHLAQYETQRKKIQKLEAEPKPGEAVLYRDFVNDHDETAPRCAICSWCWRNVKCSGGP